MGEMSKANQNSFLMKSEKAQMGIGTLIIFISAVLAAAVAAGVLIYTSGVLQERATETGKEAAQEVSTNIKVVSITGTRSNSTVALVNETKIRVAVSAGAEKLDLSQMSIYFSDGTNSVDLSYNNSTNSASQFNATELRDEDNSFSSEYPTMNTGDLVVIRINVTATGLTLDPRTKVKMTFSPEIGNTVFQSFTTPSSYGTDLEISLFP